MNNEQLSSEYLSCCEEIIKIKIQTLQEEIKNLKLKIEEINRTEEKYRSKILEFEIESISEIQDAIREKEEEIEKWQKRDPEKIAIGLEKLQSDQCENVIETLQQRKRVLLTPEDQVVSLSEEEKLILDQITKDFFVEACKFLKISEESSNKPHNQKKILQKMSEMKAEELDVINKSLERANEIANLSNEDYAKYQLKIHKRALFEAIAKRREVSLVQAMGGQAFYDVDSKILNFKYAPTVSLNEEQVASITRLSEIQFDEFINYLKDKKISKKVDKTHQALNNVVRHLVSAAGLFAAGFVFSEISIVRPVDLNEVKHIYEVLSSTSDLLAITSFIELGKSLKSLISFAKIDKMLMREQVDKYLKKQNLKSPSTQRSQ